MDPRYVIVTALLVALVMFIRIDRSPRRAARARYYRCGGRRG